MLVRTDRNALTIPDAAVQLGPNGPFTYVVKADSTVEVRPLQVGAEQRRTDRHHRRASRLDERVVTSNQYRLQAGVHVRDAAAEHAGAAAPAASARDAASAS